MQKVILVVFIVALFACVQSEQFCVKFSTYVFNNIEGVWDPIDDSCDAETLALSDANHEPHISRFTNVVAELKCDASTSLGQQVLNCLPLGQGSTMYFLSPYTNPPNDPRQFSYLYADYSDNHTFSYAKTTIEDVYDPLSDEPIPIGQSWKILYKSFLTRRRPNIPNFDAIEIQISLQPFLDTISEPAGRPSLPVDETDAVECHVGNGFVQPPIVSVFINWGSTTGISCAWRGAAKAGPVERCIPQNNQGPGQQQQPVDPPLTPITVPVTAPVDPPVAPVDPPVAPVDPPVTPVDPPVTPVDPPVAPVDPPVTPVDPPVAPVDPPVAPVDPPVTPVDPPVTPVDPPVTPVDPPVTPVDPPVTPVDPPVAPVDPPVTPVDPPVTPVDPPVAPVDPPVAPVTPPVTAPVAAPVATPVATPVTPPVTTNEPEQQPAAPTPIFAQPDGMEPPVDEPEPEPVSTPDGPIYLPGRCRPKKKDLKSTECPNKPGWHGPDCGCYVKPELECVQKLKLGRWQFYRAFFGYRINCIAGARVPEYIVQNLGPRNRGSPSSVITKTLLRVFCTKGRRYRAQWSVDWDGNTDLVWAIGRAGRDAVSTVGAKKCDSLSHSWGRNWWSWFAHGDHKRAIEFEDLGDLGGHQQRFVKSSTDIAPGQVTTAYLLPESNQLFTGRIKSCSQMTVKIQSSTPIDFIVSTEVGSYTSRTEIKTGSSWPTAFVTATVPFDDEGTGSDWNLAVTAPEANVAVFINVHCIDDGSLIGSASALSGSFFALFALALCLLALLF